MAVEMAGRVDLESPLAVGHGLNAIAIFDGQQWASLCPELDIASAGATADEAIDSLIHAVTEAVAFAQENHLEAGHPVPPDELRSFLISSQAPYVGRNFAV
jgi:hypothetical protein